MVAAVAPGQPLLWAVSDNGRVQHAIRSRVRNEHVSSRDGEHIYVDTGGTFCGVSIDLRRAQTRGLDGYECCVVCTIALSKLHRRLGQ